MENQYESEDYIVTYQCESKDDWNIDLGFKRTLRSTGRDNRPSPINIDSSERDSF